MAAGRARRVMPGDPNSACWPLAVSARVPASSLICCRISTARACRAAAGSGGSSAPAGPPACRRARYAFALNAPGSGRPPVFTGAERAEAVALACALPAETGVPLSKWSCPELARELAARCQVAASASTVRRWLAGDALKPWQRRSWISVRDADFALKAARVLDLYARRSGFAVRQGFSCRLPRARRHKARGLAETPRAKCSRSGMSAHCACRARSDARDSWVAVDRAEILAGPGGVTGSVRRRSA